MHQIALKGSDTNTVTRVNQVNSFAGLITEGVSLEAAGEVVAEALKAKLCKILGLETQERTVGEKMDSFGVDSLVALELRNWLAKEMRAELAVYEILGDVKLIDTGLAVAKKSRPNRDGAPNATLSASTRCIARGSRAMLALRYASIYNTFDETINGCLAILSRLDLAHHIYLKRGINLSGHKATHTISTMRPLLALSSLAAWLAQTTDATKTTRKPFDVLEHLGANSPWFTGPAPNVAVSGSLSRDAPTGCAVDQAVYVARHGSRYPDPGAYDGWVALHDKASQVKSSQITSTYSNTIQAAKFTAHGPLAFLNTWAPVLENPAAQLAQVSPGGYDELMDWIVLAV
ncbi:hypothetical protein GQX73_g9612 [Xylaria multiplex]|uniref:3-phytase n=1 Tax=Xylaria multiplex TaxID=323545 RepID=A0A7C8MJ93_9PEZI|nr:hypothetical protein GQX73_g9612 [Xylaria multiplex]